MSRSRATYRDPVALEAKRADVLAAVNDDLTHARPRAQYLVGAAEAANPPRPLFTYVDR